MLALLGLAMADTDPWAFDRLCTRDECPSDWRNIDGDCVLFMSGWDEARAREVCRENRAEYRDYVFLTEDSDSATRHSLPVCLVKKEYQCQCGRANRLNKIGFSIGSSALALGLSSHQTDGQRVPGGGV